MIRRKHARILNSASVHVRCLFGSSGSGSPAGGNDKKKDSSSSDSSGFAGLFGGSGGGLPQGFDPHKVRAMQDMFNSQPPEKQAEMMKKALEFQKMLGKVPFIGKISQKNIEVMEMLMQNATKGSAPSSSAPKTASASGANSEKLFAGKSAAQSAFVPNLHGSSGPTLDELQRVQLGPEIDALFEELKTMRAKKNSYRDKLRAREEELERVQRDLAQLREAETNLRARLKKAEQDVLLLNSENMELKENEKEWRLARQRNETLSAALQREQKGDAAQYKERCDSLQEQIDARENAVRSLQRKLDRLRRRDPLAKFSLQCSDISRHCAADNATAAKQTAEDAFAALRRQYDAQLTGAFAAQSAHIARAYAAVARHFFASRAPHENFDAIVTVSGDAAALRGALAACEMALEPRGDAGRFVITAPRRADAGPFAVALALHCAGRAGEPKTREKEKTMEKEKTREMEKTREKGKEKALLPFRVTAAAPHVSAALFENGARSAVQFETARASGPGGQAVNVAETQVTAKLFVDGAAVFAAETQESRSALSNREAAAEKLGKARRQQYNEQLAKHQRADAVARQIAKEIAEHGGIEVTGEVFEMACGALESGEINAVEFGFVCGLQQLALATAEMSKEL